MEEKRVSLVIPAYNEEAIIADTIKQAAEILKSVFGSYELIIADDGSTDGTAEIVRGMDVPGLRLVSYMPNRGKGCAVRTGILAATGDYIAYTDADLAYGAQAAGDILRLLIDRGTDTAFGSRKLHPDGYRDYPPLRLAASKVFSFFTGLLAGFSYDTQCGLKAYTASAAKKIFTLCETDDFSFDFEAMMLVDKMGLSVSQLPVMIINHRESKVRLLHDSVKMFGDILRIRRSVGKKLERKD